MGHKVWWYLFEMLLNLLIFAGSAGVGEMAARLAAMAGMQCFDYALF